MALEGLFHKHLATLNNGVQQNIYSFVLQNTDWMGKENITIIVSDMGNSKQSSYSLELKAGETIVLDVRNIGWNWCAGDYAVAVDNRGKEISRWNFSPKIYPPGACPECRGSHRCPACGGRGKWADRMRNYVYCPTCHGTGQCQECYVPVRGQESGNDFIASSEPPQQRKFHRAVPVIKGEIRKKERELEQVTQEYNRRTNPPAVVIGRTTDYRTILVDKPSGDFGSHTFWLSQRMVQIEHEIKALYEELADAEADQKE
jgi:hypothetical protein